MVAVVRGKHMMNVLQTVPVTMMGFVKIILHELMKIMAIVRIVVRDINVVHDHLKEMEAVIQHRYMIIVPVRVPVLSVITNVVCGMHVMERVVAKTMQQERFLLTPVIILVVEDDEGDEMFVEMVF